MSIVLTGHFSPPDGDGICFSSSIRLILFILAPPRYLAYAQRALVMAGGKLLGDGPVKTVFRDRDLMQRASVLPPQITGLAMRLGEGFEKTDTAKEVTEAVKERREGRKEKA